MSHSAVRKSAILLALAALLGSPLAAFDTYWHSQCSHKVGEQFGFTDDAWKIMQLGDFSPDFFGPVSEYAMKSPAFSIPGLDQYQAGNPQVRGAALFLHFDNLNRELQGNSDFDFIFSRLLQQTQAIHASSAHWPPRCLRCMQPRRPHHHGLRSHPHMWRLNPLLACAREALSAAHGDLILPGLLRWPRTVMMLVPADPTVDSAIGDMLQQRVSVT